MEETKIELYYQNQAKEFIDTLFDAKVFKDKITRDDMKAIEDLLAFNFQVHAKSSYKCGEMMARFKK